MSELAGERRNVAALVADVADSTSIGERLGPERSKFLFDEVVRLMSEQVRRYDGTVAQLTGDGLFAVFGAPVAHEDDSERAVRAARGIHQALATYARDVEEAYGVRLAARVSVNTGPAVLVPGEMPDQARYNALGDTVNVAARLQALAGDGGVAVGPVTARHVERAFDLEPLGDVALKGKEAAVAAYRVVGEREAEPAGLRTPLVGREDELAALAAVLEDLLDGRGAIVSITGEAGIGKTRLVAEAGQRTGGDVHVLQGHAVSYAETIPYWPVRELVRNWLGLGVSDAEARARLELKAGLAAVLGDEAEAAYPFVATMLGLTLEPDAVEHIRHLSRESVQQQTVDSVCRLARGLAAQRPLCLVFEDLHWADDSTLDLVGELLSLAEDEAVVLVLLARSERDHRSWDVAQQARRRYPHRYRELELGPLDLDTSRSLAVNAAGAELPEAVSRLIADRAGGNPFFLEEALRDLVERGALRRENGRYELATGADIAVPALVQEALQARLDRLEPDTRHVLNVAAVVGRDFGLQLLQRVGERERLVPALSELQRLDLVVEERRRPSPEYRFRHGLVQEVAYASLLEPRRRQLHGSIGRALEELHRESPAEAYGLLAWHFSAADDTAAAADYLLKAGDAARAVYANDEALEHYGDALRFLERTGDNERARKTLFKTALIHHMAFDFEQAGRAYEAACSHPAVSQRLVPSEGFEVLFSRPWDFVPGHAYITDSCWFAMHLFRGLLKIDGELNVVPDLAERVSVSRDGRTYRFGLRPDARWTDGVPVSAEDFAYAWRRMREEKTPTSHLLEDIDAARALDPVTLEVRLREPRNFFPFLLAGPWCFPWPRHHCEALGEAWRDPANLIGNGPFALTEFDDAHALLSASEQWVGARGNVRDARFTFMPTDEERHEAWRGGRGDLTWVATSIDPASASNTVASLMPGLTTMYVGFRAERPPFDDERLRKAFAHALDPSRFWHSALHEAPGRGGIVPPALAGHSHRIGLVHDIERARSLLAEAGYPDGAGLSTIDLTVPEYVSTGHGDDFVAELVAQLSALGVRAEPRIVPSRLVTSGMLGQMWVNGWEADFPDPDGMLVNMLENADVFRDAEMAALIARARSTRNEDERLRLYRELDRLLVAEHAALVPIAYPHTLLLRRPSVEGVGETLLLYLLSTADQVVVRR